MTDANDTVTLDMPEVGPADVALQQITLTRIVPSLTNPRKTFNPAKLQELADSIKVSGVHSPVLVRPLPASRLEDTQRDRIPGEPLPEFELIYGERRFRASKLAGAKSILATIRQLTDHEVLDIQITENLQRDDLTPLEEAEGYQLLMSHSELSADQVGAKIGKSRAYVYGRLKLLALCSTARAAFRDGVLDASKALLVARIPNETLQLKALKQVTETDYYGQQVSYRRAAEIVQRDFMLRLDAARFKITDADLYPAAGSCRDCVKRTGHEPDLFADIGHADVCTDPPCFHEKEARHDDIAVQAAAERGMKIIQGKEAKEAWPNSYNDTLTGYQRLDKPDQRTNSGKKTLKKLLGDDCPTPILLQSPHNGEIIEVLPKDQVNKLLKSKGLVSNELARLDASKPEHEIKARIEEKYQRVWRRRAIERVFEGVQAGVGGLSYAFIRVVARYMLSGLVNDDRQQIASLLGLGKIGSDHEIREYLQKCEDIEAEHALLLITMQHQSTWNSYSTEKGASTIELIAKEFGVDIAAIQKAVRLEQAPPPAAPEAPLPLPPAAQANGVRGEKKAKSQKTPAAPATDVPKTSTAHASAQIAEAMQALEESGQGSADASQGDDTVPVLRQAPAPSASPAPADAIKGDGSGAAKAAQRDESQAVLRQPGAGALPFAIGQAVRFKDGLRNAQRQLRKICGRNGTVESFENGEWFVRTGPKAHQVATATAGEIFPLTAPAGSEGLMHQRVKVNTTARGRDQKPHVGRTGHVYDKAGPEAWLVSLDDAAGTVAFHTTELEVVSA